MNNRFDVRRASGVPDPGGIMETGFNSSIMTSPRRRSLAQMTREAMPRLDNYKNLMSVSAAQRPTLDELYEGDDRNKVPLPEAAHVHGGHVKLGWIQGVLISVALNIWGVMLFLRVSWIVGQAGIGLSLVIISIAAFVCTVTTLSLSAISTNGQIKGGGIYYIISRSLGPEFGASVGVVFAFANTVSASMNTIGFCDSLNSLLKSAGYKIIDNSFNDTRIIGSLTLVVLIVICAVGMDYEIIAQDVFAVVIITAIVDYIVGVFIGPLNDSQIAQGFVGLSVSVYSENWAPDFQFSEGMQQNFFTTFSIFFTSVTGVQAGANISGDLKDPESAIPKGTLIAICVTMLSYYLFVLLVGGGELRAASGVVSEVASGSFRNCSFRACAYGLQYDYSVMQLMAIWGPWIYAGCFAATLSTALTNLLSVPRLIQALGYDQIYPGVIFFSKGYGPHGEPYRGYVLTLIVAEAFVLIASLNAIANLVSNFYLAAYAFINFCTFHAAFIQPLGWRPSFRYYNKWLSLAMGMICIAIMFLIDWIMALITWAIILALYLIVVYRKPDVNWGSSTQAQTYNTTLSAVYHLGHISDHVKNYRPQILVMAGHPSFRPALMDFANLITKNSSLLMCGHVSKEPLSSRQRAELNASASSWFQEQKMRGFFTLVDGLSLEEGTRALVQASGIGKLKPNILLLGYKSDWQEASDNELAEYFEVLHDAFTNRLSLVLVRLKGGFDYSRNTRNGVTNVLSGIPQSAEPDNCFVNLGYNGEADPPDSPSPHRYMVSGLDNLGFAKAFKKKDKVPSYINLYRGLEGEPLPDSIMQNMSVFKSKQTAGTLDVWWLYDDGGLTLLLPYIMSTKKKWSNCKLRIFALANKKDELEVEERNIASLLSKFRIDYSNLTMVNTGSEKPQRHTIQFFDELIAPFKERPEEKSDRECVVSESELLSFQSKTERQLRLRELLLHHSRDANMVVMTLPVPRKGVVSAPLYMAWLEVLTRDLPPFLLIRGNQTSVLTFYS